MDPKTLEILQSIKDDIGEIKVSQARTEIDLKHHILRTQQNEDAIKTLREEIKPLTAHVQRWAGVGKGLTVTGTVIGIAAAVLAAIRWWLQTP